MRWWALWSNLAASPARPHPRLTRFL